MEKSSNNIAPYQVWRRKEGGCCQVIGICKIAADGITAVAYKSLNLSDRDYTWVRPESEFIELFDPLNISLFDLPEIINQHESEEVNGKT